MPLLLIKITAAQDEFALSYHRVRGLYFLAVIFAPTIVADYGSVCTRFSYIAMYITTTTHKSHLFSNAIYGSICTCFILQHLLH